MHIEANVVKSLIKHLFGEKDNVRSRRACEEFNVHPDTWMQINEDGSETMSFAPWVLRKEERKVLCQRISKIRFPTVYDLSKLMRWVCSKEIHEALEDGLLHSHIFATT
ncbi:hypothetical protein R1sor_012836 [Riccia sorocarpa]|uniref:LAGLIDADG homing endonuclease n=1 Tax=Riccia sorocarpa TaxID=122646 RepID=A0ABD3I4X6_9MARC